MASPKRTARKPPAPQRPKTREPAPSSFDPPSDPLEIDGAQTQEFDARKNRHLEDSVSPQRQAELAREAAALRDKNERRMRDKPGHHGSRNKGDQRVHPTAGAGGAIHDENNESLGDEMHTVERENEVTEWVRPSELAIPPGARRPGYVVRWCRTSLANHRDITNLRRKKNEGWSPIRASSVRGEHSLPIIQHDALGDGDYIGAEGMLLMEMPERINRQRNAFYKAAQARQSGAIERQVRGVHSESHIGFGQIKRKSVSTVRRGSRERQSGVADDDL